MSSAEHIATIDLLRARDFPEAPGRSAAGRAGPGFHIAELATYEAAGDDDGTVRDAMEERYEAERDALTVLLTERWGEPHVISLASAFARAVAGSGDVAEPWASLSETVPDVHLWQAEGHWIALGVARWGGWEALQLLAVITETDPP
ncbi:hypothetical protein [Streptomyces spectabilis]|uniref:Uncharacterized protein n=1 Tax=Streptomyces spectabilis TaxID=68270 RepID=A0A5P2XPX1_STRST|nr:hypothetical protein [Streptomyces spectabilis]MBB5101756.1 hypothetical protein [Streptomyces spectabilis]MCI3900936.1 hypothetical protein [Streptomyces spectabilis]QEV64512.1 hypothetical protein CP982_06775 [Streptomyces spectabilis]